MPKTKKHVSLWAALMVVFFSLAGFYGIFSLVTPGPLNVSKVLAESGSGSDGDDDDDDEDGDKDDEDEKDDDDKDDEKDDEEEERIKEAKKAAEEKAKQERERIKKQAEALRKSSSGQGSGDEDEDEEDENEENEELKEKLAEILEDIYEYIIDSEERIMEAQAEGVDVSKALATLALAKEKAKAVEVSLNTLNIEEAKRLAKEVKKLAHFARNQDLHDAKKIAKEIDKVAKRISKTEGKIALYESLGGDGGKFTESLNATKAEFKAAQDLIASGGAGIATGLVNLEVVERKVKSIKNSVELAIYALGGTDDKFGDDYEDVVEDVLEDLDDVAGIEGDEVGEAIKRIAEAQKESVKTVSKSVENIDNRNAVLQFLFGTRESQLKQLEADIAANKSRIASLTEAASKIEDADVKEILNEQIAALKTETEKLQTFVGGQRDRLSAFGWFFNLF